jgi:hypothetical protein
VLGGGEGFACGWRRRRGSSRLLRIDDSLVATDLTILRMSFMQAIAA